jgi:heme/copper-type cytochrome/quinol oxidase subunit 2
MKNSNDTIGNRTRDLPTCSAVPKPTALPNNNSSSFSNYNNIVIIIIVLVIAVVVVVVVVVVVYFMYAQASRQ